MQRRRQMLVCLDEMLLLLSPLFRPIRARRRYEDVVRFTTGELEKGWQSQRLSQLAELQDSHRVLHSRNQ